MKIVANNFSLHPIPVQSLEGRLVVESRIVAILPVDQHGVLDVTSRADKSRYLRLELRTNGYVPQDAKQITEAGQLQITHTDLNHLKNAYGASHARDLHGKIVGCIYQDIEPKTAKTTITGIVPLAKKY
jgi:hypothetical protein